MEKFKILSDDGPSVTISKDDYNFLIREWSLLNALRNCGVDNWEGFELALDDLDSQE